AHDADELAIRLWPGRLTGTHVAEGQRVAAREPSFCGENVVNHVAVAHGACTAAVVCRHAAERGLCGGRHVDGIPQAVFLESGVQVVEHDARLDPCRRGGGVELEEPVHVLAVIDDEGGAHGLAALRSACTT